jgi:hypothetical protein
MLHRLPSTLTKNLESQLYKVVSLVILMQNMALSLLQERAKKNVCV